MNIPEEHDGRGGYVREGHPITHVAILLNNMVFRLPAPYRHHDVIKALADLGLPWPIKGTQGFTNASGSFYDRVNAALAVGITGGELFSEDLW